jgi:hypothetical protein
MRRCTHPMKLQAECQGKVSSLSPVRTLVTHICRKVHQDSRGFLRGIQSVRRIEHLAHCSVLLALCTKHRVAELHIHDETAKALVLRTHPLLENDVGNLWTWIVGDVSEHVRHAARIPKDDYRLLYACSAYQRGRIVQSGCTHQ